MGKPSVAERFWGKVRRGGRDRCWPWLGGARGEPRSDGARYGGFWLDGRMRGAHCVAWLLVCGDIPPGQCVLHKCDNPPCCNPSHLFLGTELDNIADRERKGRNNVSAMHDAIRGKPKSPEHRAKIAAFNRAMAVQRRGVPRPQAVKAKMSATLRAKTLRLETSRSGISFDGLSNEEADAMLARIRKDRRNQHERDKRRRAA